MKILVIILLSMLMIMQAAYQGLIYGYYTINKDYIVEHHCKNKGNPQLKCEGKCYLKNLINAKSSVQIDDTSPLSSIPSFTDIKPMVLFCETFDILLKRYKQKLVELLSSQQHYWYLFFYKYLGLFSLLRPPQLLVE